MTVSPALFPAVTVILVRDRKIRIALRTNQIAGFFTMPSRKKKKKGGYFLVKHPSQQTEQAQTMVSIVMLFDLERGRIKEMNVWTF